MELALIVNPAAGGGRVRRRWPQLESALRQRGISWQAFWTEDAGHATVLAERACGQGYDAVVAVGGDGTLNEVVNGALGSDVPVGLIPLGTGVDFSRTARLPRSPGEALDVILSGRVRRVDVGVVNNRYFCNVAGTGFDATVADRVNRSGLKRGGLIPYVQAIFQTLFTYKNASFKISLDDDTYEVTSLLMAVANGRYYGGGLMICPEAELADGCFDVCIVGDIGKISTLFLLPRVFSGGHKNHPQVTFVRARRVTVDGPAHLQVQADGELIGHLPATFEMKQAALPMLLP